MNKKRELFISLNAFLVIIVGVIVGLACKDVFNSNLGITSFVALLITLCLPTVIFLLESKTNFGFIILGVLFVAGELVTNILFMAFADWGMKKFGIVQACLIGALLIALMVNVCFIPKKEED